MGVRASEEKIFADSGRAMRLDSPVNYLAGHFGCDNLDHRDFEAGPLITHLAHFAGGIQNQQARLIDQDASLGDAFASDAVIGQPLTESHALAGSAAHGLERSFGAADESHAVMNPAGPKPALGDLETAPFAQQYVVGGNAYVLETQLRMAMGSVVISEYRQVPDHGNAGSRHRHQYHGLLFMAVSIVVV